MKNIILTVTILAATAAIGGEVDSQGGVLNAQVQVTRDSLQQVLTKIKNAESAKTTLSHPDFVEAAKKFNSKVETAMVVFENTLNKEILPQVQFYLQTLDAIEKSDAYSHDQKVALRVHQTLAIEKAFIGLSDLYHQALHKLYILDMPEIRTTTVLKTYWFEPFRKCKRFTEIEFKDGDDFELDVNTFGCSEDAKSERRTLPSYTEYFYQIRDVVFSKAILQHCKSSTCVFLLANHRKNYVNEIKDAIDKDLALARGLTLTKFPKYSDQPISEVLDWYLMPHSENSLELPFTVNQN